MTCDSFQGPVTIVLSRDGEHVAEWASAEGFHGPVPAATALQAAHVVRAWQRAYLRSPGDDELRASIEQQALANLCQALLMSNEFLYVE